MDDYLDGYEYDADWSDPAAVFAEASEIGDHATAFEAQARLNAEVTNALLAQHFEANKVPVPVPVISPEDAAAMAESNLIETHGTEYQALRGKIAERIAAEPHLLPDDAFNSPTELGRRLDAVFKIVRAEQAPSGHQPIGGKAAKDAWDQVKNADLGSYQSSMGPW